MDWEHVGLFIASIGTLATAIVTAYLGLQGARRSARKDELNLLREEVERQAGRLRRADRRIDELERENRNLNRQVAILLAENAMLRSVLLARGIPVPELPTLADTGPLEPMPPPECDDAPERKAVDDG